jgi:hypothetical protein
MTKWHDDHRCDEDTSPLDELDEGLKRLAQRLARENKEAEIERRLKEDRRKGKGGGR